MASNPSQPESKYRFTLDARVIDTTPGAHQQSPFAPPAGWEGDAQVYMQLMRERYKAVSYAQRLGFAARFARSNSVLCIGPFAEQARMVLAGLVRNSNHDNS